MTGSHCVHTALVLIHEDRKCGVLALEASGTLGKVNSGMVNSGMVGTV
jgi:hypothetical protein